MNYITLIMPLNCGIIIIIIIEFILIRAKVFLAKMIGRHGMQFRGQDFQFRKCCNNSLGSYWSAE